MILRLIGVVILLAAAMGTVVAVLGLRQSPEKIREITWASLFTAGGMLCVGFGLAFSAGVSRGVLIIGGILAYLYGLALSLTKRHEQSQT
jgi:hypothetical protein